MTWIFEVSVVATICEPKKINFFFGSDKLLTTEIKSEQGYNYVDAWNAMTQSKWKFFFGYEFFLVVVVGENIDDWKFNTFFFLRGRGGGGERNDQ